MTINKEQRIKGGENHKIRRHTVCNIQYTKARKNEGIGQKQSTRACRMSTISTDWKSIFVAGANLNAALATQLPLEAAHLPSPWKISIHKRIEY